MVTTTLDTVFWSFLSWSLGIAYIIVSTEAHAQVVLDKIHQAGARATVFTWRGQYRVGSPDLDRAWFAHHIPTPEHEPDQCRWCPH